MVCTGKNIANGSKNPQFQPITCALCLRCAHTPPYKPPPPHKKKNKGNHRQPPTSRPKHAEGHNKEVALYWALGRHTKAMARPHHTPPWSGTKTPPPPPPSHAHPSGHQQICPDGAQGEFLGQMQDGDLGSGSCWTRLWIQKHGRRTGPWVGPYGRSCITPGLKGGGGAADPNQPKKPLIATAEWRTQGDIQY